MESDESLVEQSKDSGVGMYLRQRGPKQFQLIADTQHYYVDEAGDGVLFDKHGRNIVGAEGCSKFFILGAIRIPSSCAIGSELEKLRADLLADKYFHGVPSFDPGRGRIVKGFHAKDDPPEVRREVFRVIDSYRIRFTAVVRSKAAVLTDVQNKNRVDATYRYMPNMLYDDMVDKLFRNKLHRHIDYKIVFAGRGRSDRTAALKTAIEKSRRLFLTRAGITSNSTYTIKIARSYDSAEFQVADYALWAVQRLYKRGEDRWVNYLGRNVSLVHDLDDCRYSGAGVHYQKNKPLSLHELQGHPGI